MTIRVCVAGATGWAGSAVTRALRDAPDCTLVGGIARRQAGRDLGSVLGGPPLGLPIVASLAEVAAARPDVLVDYTGPESVRARIGEALESGLRVVVGTSGLTAADYAAIDDQARARGLGVIAAGNFSITAALAKHCALLAARYLPSWEILDYAAAEKPDVPSGTTRELAEALGVQAANQLGRPINQLHGPSEARGAQIAGTPVHSIRLPGYVIAFETVFGLPDERLTIRHDAGSSAAPYVAGTLLAVRRVVTITGLVRGLDRLLFEALGPAP